MSKQNNEKKKSDKTAPTRTPKEKKAVKILKKQQKNDADKLIEKQSK